jgi:sulfur carrier protein
MKLIINGEAKDYLAEPSLKALLIAQGANPDRVAVLVNGEIVPRLEREGRVLREGDRVEILIFAGGG